MQYLTIPELERWQHYKDRRPPWMKLHVEIFDDYEMAMLPDATKYHLLGIWLLATQIDNKIPNDNKWLQNKIGARGEIDIKLLIDKGMLTEHAASMPLATCKQNAIAEAEAEAETETDIAGGGFVDPGEEKPPSVRKSPCPFSKILGLYHQKLPALSRVVTLTDKRKRSLSARWRNGMHDLEHWEAYFDDVSKSRFLMGRIDPTPGRKQFVADFDFLIREQTIVRTQEGKYHDRISQSSR